MLDTHALQQLIDGDLATDISELSSHSRDASIFAITPQAVIYPKSSHDIQNIVRYVTEHKKIDPSLSLTARSGGTDMTGGSINDSLIFDFTRYMNQITGWGQYQAQVQPGMFYRDFEKATLAKGLIMPAYPASKSICAIGGMVGNNAGGEKSMSYGQVKDYVQSVTAILADGNEYTFSPLNSGELAEKMKLQTFEGQIYRQIFALIENNYDKIKQAKPTTSKNSSGYFLWDVWDKHTFDLTKLFTGSQGTLGIMTNTTLRLVQPKPQSQLLVIFLRDLTQLGNLIDTVKQFKPESFELYDDHTLRLAMRYWREMIAKMDGKAWRLTLQFLPEFLMTLTGGTPKLVLLAEFTGDNNEIIHKNLDTARAAVTTQYHAKTHVAASRFEAQKYWTIRRESYNLLRNHTPNKIAACFIEDIVVHPDQLPEFLPRLNAIFARYPNFTYTIAGHAGDANFHIMPLMNFADDNEREIVERLSNEVFDLIKEFQGSMTAEHNDGLVRGPFLEKMFGPDILSIFKQVKNIFDPLNIFNPHKKTDARMDFFMAHMRRK